MGKRRKKKTRTINTHGSPIVTESLSVKPGRTGALFGPLSVDLSSGDGDFPEDFLSMSEQQQVMQYSAGLLDEEPSVRPFFFYFTLACVDGDRRVVRASLELYVKLLTALPEDYHPDDGKGDDYPLLLRLGTISASHAIFTSYMKLLSSAVMAGEPAALSHLENEVLRKYYSDVCRVVEQKGRISERDYRELFVRVSDLNDGEHDSDSEMSSRKRASICFLFAHAAGIPIDRDMWGYMLFVASEVEETRKAYTFYRKPSVRFSKKISDDAGKLCDDVIRMHKRSAYILDTDSGFEPEGDIEYAFSGMAKTSCGDFENYVFSAVFAGIEADEEAADGEKSEFAVQAAEAVKDAKRFLRQGAGQTEIVAFLDLLVRLSPLFTERFFDSFDSLIRRFALLLADGIKNFPPVIPEGGGDTKVVSDEQSVADDDVAVAEELASAKARIAELKSKLSVAQEKIESMRADAAKAAVMEAELADEKFARAKLQEYVWSITEDCSGDHLSGVSVDDMARAIEDEDIAILGGHENWIYKLKNRFPKWKFIKPSAYSMSERSILQAKKVYMFTDHLDHGTYMKFMNYARQHDVPVGYMHEVNIDKNIRQVYGDLCRKR